MPIQVRHPMHGWATKRGLVAQGRYDPPGNIAGYMVQIDPAGDGVGLIIIGSLLVAPSGPYWALSFRPVAPGQYHLVIYDRTNPAEQPYVASVSARDSYGVSINWPDHDGVTVTPTFWPYGTANHALTSATCDSASIDTRNQPDANGFWTLQVTVTDPAGTYTLTVNETGGASASRSVNVQP